MPKSSEVEKNNDVFAKAFKRAVAKQIKKIDDDVVETYKRLNIDINRVNSFAKASFEVLMREIEECDTTASKYAVFVVACCVLNDEESFELGVPLHELVELELGKQEA